MPLALALPPTLFIPARPALVRAGEPWEHRVGEQLARAGLPMGARLAVLAELRRLQQAAGLIGADNLADVSRWSGVKLAMMPGVTPIIWQRPAPAVAATATFADSTGGTTSAVTLPSGIAAGDRLIILGAYNNNTTDTVTISGFTSFFSMATKNGRTQVFGFYKTATGSEGATVTLSNPSGGDTATVAYRITNSTSVPEAGTTASGTSTSADPPSVTASAGAVDNLWLAFAGAADTVSGTPTSFSNLLTANSRAGSSGAHIGSTQFASTATATVNPSVYTVASSANWLAQTVVVGP